MSRIAAVADAIDFLRESTQPHALLWLSVMHRYFAIDEFADALQRFDAHLARQPADLHLLRVFRRIAVRENEIVYDDLEAVSERSDRIVVSGLYCDQLGVPASFPQVLAKDLRKGGYFATHALLAWVWMQKYGGGASLPEALVDEIHRVNATIVNADPAAVSDLPLEAAAFLCLAGQADSIDAGFMENVVRCQNSDGGWGQDRNDDQRSDWHATILALLYLLHRTQQPVRAYLD